MLVILPGSGDIEMNKIRAVSFKNEVWKEIGLNNLIIFLWLYAVKFINICFSMYDLLKPVVIRIEESELGVSKNLSM